MISRTGVESDVEEVGVNAPPSFRRTFVRMMLLNWELRGDPWVHSIARLRTG